MKDKIIKIVIDIESEMSHSIKIDIRVMDMLFTKYNRMFSAEEFVSDYNKAMRKVKNFKMITATLMMYDEGVYLPERITKSFRFVNNHSDVQMSRWNGERYNDFNTSDKKEIIPMLKAMVSDANSLYVEQIKNQTQNEHTKIC